MATANTETTPGLFVSVHREQDTGGVVIALSDVATHALSDLLDTLDPQDIRHETGLPAAADLLNALANQLNRAVYGV